MNRQLLPLLSDSERDRLGKIRSERKRQEYLMSRALMRHALGATLNQPCSELRFSENGALPDIAPYPDHFSLSHSHKLIGIALSTSPVGLDIEWLRRDARPALQNYINDGQDREVLDRYQNLSADERFTYSWSLREAWYKADSSHQSIPITSLALMQIEQSGWFSYTTRIADHLCVIAVPEASQVDIHYCTPFADRRPITPAIRPIQLANQ